VLFLFLPLFAQRGTDYVQSVSLIALGGVRGYLKTIYFVIVALAGMLGVLTLSLQCFDCEPWKKINTCISVSLSLISAFVFIISLQPYAAVFSLSLLAVKVIMLLKR
jgi:hypothetical protein